ncbi:scavenger receptor class B member 1 isoform X1 [Sitodiplosis mosellana]|uniref:scavenger receptor class B member 1 isoform X1 n=1 Tax=Sitodiplosis mosellana TaxID=263140 RepID=UPI002444BA18|nr:scavenger receptor class B member 1 isoform X1 [Sitodiplosis mosellana]XP_055318864.1 scavenger receptor class B member 1 isoform X1 [Sitodiplosis mosellana]XP_055318865.1 scavenger receptor class B member 1 isoform X1 [Sitodiplosis mosellana]XP_055318866.1 scavenger receptor class B member 1 isoform X1 [Sitodiplosis mosellana]XP_055318867.1 scavenger receptor class B member 1 isoform X1 [Sitodiplosis mosellana]XP_055318869.1 scavenger receptor class B member 1 isoform X1 [Sitodiplosis mose
MHGNRNKLCAKLSSAFLRKWWFVIAFALCLLLCGILVTFGFTAIVKLVIDHQVALRPGAQSFGWWSKPPVEPMMKIYVYNVTNADEFLNNGTKPILDELGPYVYVESWEKVDIVHNENGTISFNQKKTFIFNEELSNGSEDDVVIVPNIPMLSATSQSKHAARFLRLAMASIMDILKIKPFVEVSVGQLLWGYEDPLLKLAKDVVPKEQKLPYEEFGVLYGKNSTSPDRVTIFSGVNDIKQFGIIDKYNGVSYLPHWSTPACNHLNGTDGSIFPPHITKNTTLHLYDKDLCRLMPLSFEKEVTTRNNVPGYRFTPSEKVFASVEKNPDNVCFCPHGPPCAPHGMFNVSACQYDSPILLSFPHFYMGDPTLRLQVEGMTPPEKEKHQFFIDVQPEMGTSLRARARVQINLAVSQVIDIKQVANFPDIIFPILWFEEGIDGLPEEITSLMLLATQVPPKARSTLMLVLFIVGALLLLIAVTCLVRRSHRQSTLHLASNYLATSAVDQAKKKAQSEHKRY